MEREICKKEGIRLTLKSECKQNCDWDVIVPDSKPDIVKIIKTDGAVSIQSKEITADRAVINCNVRVNIIYTGADEKTSARNIECTHNVNCIMSANGMKPDMILSLDASLEKLTANIINSRKLNVSCNIVCTGEAYESYVIDYIDLIEGDGLKYKTSDVEGLNLVDCIEEKLSLSDEIEIPSGKSSAECILEIKPVFTDMDIKNAGGKFVLRGNVNVTTVYNSTSDSDGIQYMVNETPVNEIVDSPYVSEDAVVDCEVSVSNFNYILKENPEGEKRRIKYTCDVDIEGKVFERINISPICDVYSVCNDIEMKTDKCHLDLFGKNEAGQIRLREVITTGNKKDIQRIICVNAKSLVDKIYKDSSQLKLNGRIVAELMYQSVGNELCNVKSEFPFESFIDAGELHEYTNYELKNWVEACSYNILSPDSVEIRVSVGYKIKVKNTRELSYVKEYKILGKSNECKKGISVIFCNGTEQLWDIAKKYKTTAEEILKVNELKGEDEIIKGIKLLIP